MINNTDIVVFDFETGGLNWEWNEAIQVAGKAYNARSLEPYPDGEFMTLMKPLYKDRLDPKALQVNGKTVDMLFGNEEKGIKPAPDQGVAWNNFVKWVGRWNKGKKDWTAPIAAGKNIWAFDFNFVAVLNRLHCKGDKTVLFNKRRFIDLEDYIFAWFENEAEPAKENMDALREYFGLSTDGAHDALVDVRQTGDLIMRFLKLHREMQRRVGKDGTKLIKFKGAFGRKAA